MHQNPLIFIKALLVQMPLTMTSRFALSWPLQPLLSVLSVRHRLLFYPLRIVLLELLYLKIWKPYKKNILIHVLQIKKRAVVNHLKYQTVGINHSVPHPLSADVKSISMATGIRNSNLWETLCLLQHMDILAWFWAKSWENKPLTNIYMLFLSLLRSNIWIMN
jgi:hypothetical protein